MTIAVPSRTRRKLPVARVRSEIVGRHILPFHHCAVVLDCIGYEWIEKPLAIELRFRFFELTSDRAQLLAQLYAKPDGVIPEDLSLASLHHLRPDVKRGEQRIERRGGGMHHEHLVEPAMFNTPALAG